MDKKKKEDDTFLRKKNRRKPKQCYHNDICRWKRNSFSDELEISGGIVCIKILKKKYYLPQPKVLRKYRRRFSLLRNSLNLKHHSPSKSMSSKYHMIKIFENCFQNLNNFSWIKLIAVLIHPKY